MDVETQSLLSFALPTLAVLCGILVNNSSLLDLRSHMDTRFDLMQQVIDARFRDSKAELRVEGVVDARLKHVEERYK